MTISIRTFLAQEMDSKHHAPLSWDEVSKHVRDHYINDTDEIARRAMHLKRERLYRNEGDVYVNELIDRVFAQRSIADKLKAWASISKFDNFLARIVGEHSTVYQDPAVRKVGGSDENQRRYKEVQRLSKLAAKSAAMNARLTLHRALLVGFRVRNKGTLEDIRNEPVIDVVTPDRAFLVTHPNDPVHVIAVGIKIKTTYARGLGPEWVVWSEHERFHMDSGGRILPRSIVEHGIGRIPYVLVSLEESSTSPWPGAAGEDLVAAHMSIWFSDLSLLKELKSSTKLPIMSGDTTAAVRDQAADTEAPMELPEGTSLTTLELGMDLGKFQTASRHISEVAANNHGLSGALLRHQGVQSADARDLMRVPLREIRIKQQTPLREYERELVLVMAAVIAVDMPELEFDPEGWAIDFADPQTPRSVKELLEEFEHARRLTLDNTIRFIMRRNPDLDVEDARAVVEENILEEAWRNEALRPLVAKSGSPGAETPDLNTQSDDAQIETSKDVSEEDEE